MTKIVLTNGVVERDVDGVNVYSFGAMSGRCAWVSQRSGRWIFCVSMRGNTTYFYDDADARFRSTEDVIQWVGPHWSPLDELVVEMKSRPAPTLIDEVIR